MESEALVSRTSKPSWSCLNNRNISNIHDGDTDSLHLERTFHGLNLMLNALRVPLYPIDANSLEKAPSLAVSPVMKRRLREVKLLDHTSSHSWWVAECGFEPWSLTPKPPSEPPRLVVFAGGDRDPRGPAHPGEVAGWGGQSGGISLPV